METTGNSTGFISLLHGGPLQRCRASLGSAQKYVASHSPPCAISRPQGACRVAVKELKLSYYDKGTLLFTIYYIPILW